MYTSNIYHYKIRKLVMLSEYFCFSTDQFSSSFTLGTANSHKG